MPWTPARSSAFAIATAWSRRPGSTGAWTWNLRWASRSPVARAAEVMMSRLPAYAGRWCAAPQEPVGRSVRSARPQAPPSSRSERCLCPCPCPCPGSSTGISGAAGGLAASERLDLVGVAAGGASVHGHGQGRSTARYARRAPGPRGRGWSSGPAAAARTARPARAGSPARSPSPRRPSPRRSRRSRAATRSAPATCGGTSCTPTRGA
jgi:hypothetical protein